MIEIHNVYLSEMSEAILNHEARVTYMGDGIFAVFGPPIEQPVTPTVRSQPDARC